MSKYQRLPRIGANLSRIAVDLTPLLPGGENGGAKLVAIETVRELGHLLSDCQFLLLTSERSHDELAQLDAGNVVRRCVHRPSPAPGPEGVQTKKQLRVLSLAELVSLVPPSVRSALSPSTRNAIKSLLRRASGRGRTHGLVKQFGADLLFCPFTMSFYHDPAVPTISLVHDLQYLSYPQFFDEEDRWTRARIFDEACRLSSRLVCVSDFVRGTVLDNSDLRPERVVTIRTRLAGRLPKPPAEQRLCVLDNLRLSENGFFLYPANFWVHKNHRMLFTAYGMYRTRNPQSPFRLVCTGSPDDRMRSLGEAVSQMGLEQWVCFPGFLTDVDFATLLASCYALVFPSLYEGFGMPVLEAMRMGKPVLCSNVTSLPEVAGDAAIYFSPARPDEIVDAMENITEDGSLVRQLVAKGFEHSAAYTNAAKMASEYLAVFREALG